MSSDGVLDDLAMEEAVAAYPHWPFLLAGAVSLALHLIAFVVPFGVLLAMDL